ncbi:hypothetical protein M5689_024414 [Euphorbia peplus]|nr:hypothetical protein M5689_024414 [Euphorbia peplus]
MEATPNPMSNNRPRVFHIDDGGSFDRLLQECRRSVFGCTTDHTLEAEAMNLLQLRVVEGFVNRLSKDASFKTTTTTTTSTTLSSCGAVVDQEKNKPIKLKFVLKRKPEDTNLRSDDIDAEENIIKKAKKMKSDDVFGGMINQPKLSIIEVGTKIIRFNDKGLEPPRLSMELQQRIEKKGGRDIKLVIVKRVHETDLQKKEARLTIPLKQIKDESFLEIQEISVMTPNAKLPAMLMAPCGHEISMDFTKWKVNKSFSYALIKHWSQVLDRNLTHKYFKLGDDILLWSFKVGSQLWFTFDKV